MKNYYEAIIEKYYKTLTEKQKEKAFMDMACYCYETDYLCAYDDEDGVRVCWDGNGEPVGK